MADGGAHGGDGRGSDGESLSDVLSSIRELVSAERDARAPSGPDGDVLVLSREMRVKPGVPARRDGEILTEGFGGTHQAQSAPILDEVALRGVINSIVREELQGEMGDRISRNLRKLIRQELSQMLKDERGG
jgi:hypothetical protein